MAWFKKQQKGRQPKLMQGQQGYVFRRSRTLTGTTSAAVNPTAEGRGQLKTARLKAHERKARLVAFMRSLAIWLGVAAVVAFLIFVCIKNPVVTFANAGGTPDANEYTHSINNYLAGHPLERFAVGMDEANLVNYIKNEHSEVSGVEVSNNWYGGDVSFTISFRQPLVVWQTAGQKFYVDADGIAFTYNHFGEPSVVVTDESGIAPEVGGGAVASGRFIKFLGQIVGAVNSYDKGKVASVTIPHSTRQIDLRLAGRDYPIKTHIDRDPIGQAEDIANALAYFDSKNVKPQYVDVRVPHKAFYK